MSFFDKLGKTVTNTAHSVVEKTKSSTETIRLNGLINDEEKNINAAYLNMGRKYAELHTADAEPEFQEFLSAIAASQEKIAEYREQIRKTKHLLICQGCGAEIPETVLYCTKCGAENPVGKQLAEERAAREAAERAQREAEAQKAQAEAMRFAREQEAAGIRAVGEAEASAIQAKGIAEAEAMEKKAEAYAKYNKAAVAEMMIKVLPDIAGKVAEPLGQIDKITIIGGGEGGSNGVDQIAGNVPVVMAKVFESMKEATGIDLADIINAESYDAKVNRNVNVSGLDSVNFVVKDDGTKVTMAKVEPQNSTKPVSTDVPESGEQG